MEHYDREKAQRVWHRVQAQRADLPLTPMVQPNPEGLLLEELTDIRLLQQLVRQQKDPAPLRALITQGQNRAAVLRCICKLSSLTPPSALPSIEAPEFSAGLRRLMGRLLRRRKEYQQLREHTEFGALYDALAQEIQVTALTLARIMGKG